MHYQLTLYPVLDRWQITLIRHEATDAGYQWSHLVSELLPAPLWVAEEPWDIVWLAGERLCEVALERSSVRELRPDSTPPWL
jgi:hypothetical protein